MYLKSIGIILLDMRTKAELVDRPYSLIHHPGFEEMTSYPDAIAAAQAKGLRVTFGKRVATPGRISDGLKESTIVWDAEPTA